MLNLINIQPQEAQDCGLYALAIAYDLCAGRDPFETIYDQLRMRLHLLFCFEQGVITAFPVLKKTTCLVRVPQTVQVPVFFACRQPERNPMACCDSCSEWYHQTCVSIPQVVSQDQDTAWTCSSLCKYLCAFIFVCLLQFQVKSLLLQLTPQLVASLNQPWEEREEAELVCTVYVVCLTVSVSVNNISCTISTHTLVESSTTAGGISEPTSGREAKLVCTVYMYVVCLTVSVCIDISCAIPPTHFLWLLRAAP